MDQSSEVLLYWGQRVHWASSSLASNGSSCLRPKDFSRASGSQRVRSTQRSSDTGLTQADLTISELARPQWQTRCIYFTIYCMYCQITFAHHSTLPKRSSFRPAPLLCSDALQQGQHLAGMRLAGERQQRKTMGRSTRCPLPGPCGESRTASLGMLTNPCANSAAACPVHGGKRARASPTAHLPVVVF